MLNSAYGARVTTALTSLGASPATVSAAKRSIITGLGTAAQLPSPDRAAAVTGVRNAFMAGVHSGSAAAAIATGAAALLALAFLPSRVRG